MKKRYTEEQIMQAIKRHESGVKVDEICRDLGISAGTFCNWRSKYTGLEVNDGTRLKVLGSESYNLKPVMADKPLEVEAMRDALEKKSGGLSQTLRSG